MPDPMISILPLAPLLSAAAAHLELDRIFFQASSRQTFADAVERARFRERWLGRYLGADAGHGFAAVIQDDHGGPPCSGRCRIVGYVVGAMDNPALAPRFSDFGYGEEFLRYCAAFPAHLHINLLADHRGRGIGTRLIEAFCSHVAEASRAARAAAVEGQVAAPPNVCGVHVVTSANARNVGFYNQNGFKERARTGSAADALVFLARRSQ